jgi:hypothetical protein
MAYRRIDLRAAICDWILMRSAPTILVFLGYREVMNEMIHISSTRSLRSPQNQPTEDAPCIGSHAKS